MDAPIVAAVAAALLAVVAAGFTEISKTASKDAYDATRRRIRRNRAPSSAASAADDQSSTSLSDPSQPAAKRSPGDFRTIKGHSVSVTDAASVNFGKKINVTIDNRREQRSTGQSGDPGPT